MSKGDLEKQAVRTTIVGGRPPGSGRDYTINVPRGVEVLVKKAAVDAAFRQVLLAQRGAAAAAIGLQLDPAEQAMLSTIPQAHLARIIDQTVVPTEQRHVFLGHVAAAMLVALGVTLVLTTEDIVTAGGGRAGLSGSIGSAVHGTSGFADNGAPAARGLIVITDTRPAASSAPAKAPAATRPLFDWNDSAAVGRLVQDLCDGDYAVRERGQKVLDAIPRDQYQKVQDLAERVTDVEAHSRLAARASAMILDVALNPPAISLDVKEATLAEVAAAFSKALGVPVTAATSSATYRDERYTISVKDRSFWDIIKDGPFWVSTGAGGNMTLLRDSAPWNAMQVNGGVCIAMDGPRKPAGAALPQAGGNVDFSAALAIALDRRLTVSEIRPPEITSATDQAGRPLPLRTLAVPPTVVQAAAQRRMLPTSIAWSQPADEAAAITSICVTGRWSLVVLIPDSKTGVMKDLPVTIPFEFKHLPVR
jgi:hypothetical protein